MDEKSDLWFGVVCFRFSQPRFASGRNTVYRIDQQFCPLSGDVAAFLCRADAIFYLSIALAAIGLLLALWGLLEPKK